MKHLKSKLMASAAMLMVATVMISSASFAWFTISAAPEVKGVSANVATNGNLEIALDNGTRTVPVSSTTASTGKNETWGNLVDLSGAFVTGTTNVFTLKPVASDATKVSGDSATGEITFSAPTFGTDGRVSGTTALTKFTIPDGSAETFKDYGGVHVFSTETRTGSTETDLVVSGTNSKASTVWAYEIDYWLRSNAVDNKISLTTPLNRDGSAVAADATADGLGSYITNKNVTVKLVITPYTVAADGTATAGTSTEVPVKVGTLANGKYPLTIETANQFTLTQNQPTLVKMYVYWEGTSMDNKDFGTGASGEDNTFQMNVQFVGSNTGNAMAVN